jgi:plastocyanin
MFSKRLFLAGALAIGALPVFGVPANDASGVLAAADAAPPHRRHVVVPGEDRFRPFNQTIHVGDFVIWVNQDTDDHTIVSDDTFNSTGPRKVDVLLPGTDSNGGKFGRYAIFFNEAGTWVYHCRFHSHLDSADQPVAPGPKGGIQDTDGNFGTPMMGVITVLP